MKKVYVLNYTNQLGILENVIVFTEEEKAYIEAKKILKQLIKDLDITDLNLKKTIEELQEEMCLEHDGLFELKVIEAELK